MVTAAAGRATGGFSLVEVLVAMVVLGAGVVLVAAGTAVAAAMLRRAEAHDRAVAAAAAVLDSIAAADEAAPGETRRGDVRLTWDAVRRNGTVLVRVVAEPVGSRDVVLEMHWAPPPPLLEPVR